MDDDSEYDLLSSEMRRPPSVEDLVHLCAELNAKGSKYIV